MFSVVSECRRSAWSGPAKKSGKERVGVRYPTRVAIF